MRVAGTLGIGAMELPAITRQRSAQSEDSVATRPDTVQRPSIGPKSPDARSPLPVDMNVLEGVNAEHVAAAIVRKPVETYAKIRFDDQTHAVLIQIVNAANDEVIREFPPDAWLKFKQSNVIPIGSPANK